MPKNSYAGTWTALITPFKTDGSLDEAALRTLVQRQIHGGVTGIVPVGTTGESPTTTTEEDARIFEIVKEECAAIQNDPRSKTPKPKVMAGTGSNCTKDAVKYTQTAQKAGADCCLVVTPYYNKPTPSGLIQHFHAVADVGLPVIVYNIKGRTGVNIDTDTLMKIADHPNIVGVKEASGDIEQITEVIRRRPEDFTVLSGDDSLTLEVIRRGGDGVVSVASNLVPEKVVELVNIALKARMESPSHNQESASILEAQNLNDHLSQLFKELFVETNPIPVKYIASRMGLCELKYRLPLCEPSENAKKRLEALIELYQLTIEH